MREIKMSRRALLARACQVPVAGAAVFIAGCGENKVAATCGDPKQLTDSENSLRTSVQYTEQTRDPAKSCSGCAFFHAGADAASCGKCDILNGAVSPNGHCMSWSARK